jgi:hypothetical protein
MNKEIQHHGAQDKGFRPPHTIYNKQTGEDKEPLPKKLSDELPDKLLEEIKYFLQNMNAMPEDIRMRKCIEIMRKINEKLKKK